MSDQYCVILTTTDDRGEADRIADLLVSRRLAACVQALQIGSTYMWKGELTKGSEWLLLVKTVSHLYREVEAAILELHSYDVPEVVQVPIEQGLDRYLAWITENAKPAAGIS